MAWTTTVMVMWTMCMGMTLPTAPAIRRIQVFMGHMWRGRSRRRETTNWG